MAIFFTTHGSGTVEPAPIPIVSLSAQFAFKAQMLVDYLLPVDSANVGGLGLFQIDSDGKGTNKKIEALLNTASEITPLSASITFTSNSGIALSDNHAPLGTAATLCVVVRMRVDEWTALGSGGKFGIVNIDNGTFTNAASRLGVYLARPSTGFYQAAVVTPEENLLTTGLISASSMPANGSDVVIYTTMTGGGGAGKIRVYTEAGTNTLIDPAATGSVNGVAVPGNGGRVRINAAVAGGSSVLVGNTCRYQGVGVYTAARPAGFEDAIPTTGDANLGFLCKMQDATSGTLPVTASSQIGGGGMALTQFSWSLDGTPGQWNNSTGGIISAINSSSICLRINAPAGGSQTVLINKSSLPAGGLGNVVTLYGDWSAFLQHQAIFDATGTLLIANTASVNDGPLVVSGSNGIVTINAAWDGATYSSIIDSIAFYSATQPFASWSQAPFTGEATLVYLAKLNEYPSGSMTTPASASVGQTGITLASAGNFTWINAATSSWFPPQAVIASCSLLPVTSSVSISSSGYFAGYYGGFTASIFDNFGNPVVGGPPIIWTTGASNLLVSNIGTVTAINSGSGFITGTVSGTAVAGYGYVFVSEYDWFSSAPSIATVDVTGTFVYKAFGNAVITCSRHGTSAVGFDFVTGSNLVIIDVSSVIVSSSIGGVSITVTVPSSTLPNLLSEWDFAIMGQVPNAASTSPTTNNPGGCVTFGNETDHSVFPRIPNPLFPSGYAIQIADGAGLAWQWGPATSVPVVGASWFFIVEWEEYFGATFVAQPYNDGDWKWLRTSQDFNYRGGSLLTVFGDVWLYWDGGSTDVGNYRPSSVNSLCDGKVHRLRMVYNAVAAPNEYLAFYVDGVLQGKYDDAEITALGNTYYALGTNGVPSTPWISQVAFFETINNPVGGIRQIGRVWASTTDFASPISPAFNSFMLPNLPSSMVQISIKANNITGAGEGYPGTWTAPTPSSNFALISDATCPFVNVSQSVAQVTYPIGLTPGANPIASNYVPPVVSNEPAGYIPVININQIQDTFLNGSPFTEGVGYTGSSTSWTNPSGTTNTFSVAEIELNFTGNGGYGGWRAQYQPTLAPGGSPSAIISPTFGYVGTGNCYVAFVVRLSPTWTNNGNTYQKYFSLGNGTSVAQNVIGAMINGSATDNYLAMFVNNNVSQSTYHNFGSAMSQFGGTNRNIHSFVECLMTHETTAGTSGDGTFTAWVSGTQVMKFTNVNYFNVGDTMKWSNITWGPNYGYNSGSDSPASSSASDGTAYMWQDIDQIYVSVN